MSKLDVLIVGGYGLTEKAGGGRETRDRIRMHYKGRPVTLDFIQALVAESGDLAGAERRFAQVDQSKYVARSLNVIYLYDFLTKQGLNVEVVNYFTLERQKFDQLMALKPGVVAISTTFISEASDTVEIANAARQISPDSVIIAGGTKVLKSSKKLQLFQQGGLQGFDPELLKERNFFFRDDIDHHLDAFVIEENGELTLTELVRRVRDGENWQALPNLAYRRDHELVLTPRIAEPYSFETHAISWDRIPHEIIGHEIPVRAGMGCPFKCAFCDFTGLHSKVRLRPIESLICELKAIQRAFPGKPVFFTDDNLFISRHRTKRLCQAIVDAGLQFPWRAFFRVDAICEDNVELVARSGCRMALLGVESGSTEILERMCKRNSPSSTLRAVELLNRHGVSTLSTVIVGFPGETSFTLQSTIDLLNDYPEPKRAINTYYPFRFILCPLAPASTPDFRSRHSVSGVYDEWNHTTMDSSGADDSLSELFRSVDVCPLQYPEGRVLQMPAEVLKNTLLTRDNLVKSGINVLNEANAKQVYQAFAKILKPQTSSQPTHQPTASPAA